MSVLSYETKGFNEGKYDLAYAVAIHPSDTTTCEIDCKKCDNQYIIFGRYNLNRDDVVRWMNDETKWVAQVCPECIEKKETEQ